MRIGPRSSASALATSRGQYPRISRGHMVAEVVGMDLLQRHGAVFVANEHGLAAQPLQPFDDILRVADAAAQQQQLGLRRRQGHGQLVIQAAVQVAEHLVFVHDQQGGAVALDEAVLLGLQRGDQHRRARGFRPGRRWRCRHPSRGRAIRRACRWPARGWARCRWPGRDSCPALDQSSKISVLPAPVGACTTTSWPSRRARDGLLLPEVGHRDLVEGGQLGQG